MKTAFSILLGLLLCWAAAMPGAGQEDAASPDAAAPVLVIDLQGPIGPATRDFVVRSLETAAERDAGLFVIRMDTPGGLDASTRDIIKVILRSPVPVATFVTPEGARAASAGAYILYASHIAAMSPATNVGAATPVSIMGGQQSPARGDGGDDSREDEAASPADPMNRKAVNDSVAYIRGLAELRGRNADWAERAVREAVSVTSKRALELGVIDFIALDLEQLLAASDGRRVQVGEREIELDTTDAPVTVVAPDWRNELLATITSPTIAYLLLLVGIYGLILEGYNPGAILPGVVGAICLLLALYSLQMLPVNYAGLGLIALGIILMIAESMAPSFGVLGFGGIIAVVIGSIILIDADVPGMMVSRGLIGAVAAVAAAGMMTIIAFALKARGRPIVSGREELIGAVGRAIDAFDGDGQVWLHGEIWNAVTEIPVDAGEEIEVVGRDGLVLRVRPRGR